MGVGLKVAEKHDVFIVIKAVCEAHRIQGDHLCLKILIDIVGNVCFIVLIVWLYPQFKNDKSYSALSQLGLEMVLVVHHIFAAPLPEISPILLVLLHRVYEWFHAIVV